jgi:hypothetical protein
LGQPRLTMPTRGWLLLIYCSPELVRDVAHPVRG